MAGESARQRAQKARERAERLQRVAEKYEKGAEGESATAAVLAQLPPSWVVLHDLRWPGRKFANIDHVVIGPGGVFVVDSKNWSGVISVDDGVLRQNGRSRETTVAGCAESALAIAGLVPQYARWVRPVLCFTRDEPMGGWSRDVMIASTPTLLEMLQSRPPVLDAAAVGYLRWTIDAGTLSAVDLVPAGAGAPARHTKARSAGRSRRKKSRSSPGGVLIRLALCLVALMFLPAVASALGPALSGLLTDVMTPEDMCTSAANPSATCTPEADRKPVKKRPVKTDPAKKEPAKKGPAGQRGGAERSAD